VVCSVVRVCMRAFVHAHMCACIRACARNVQNNPNYTELYTTRTVCSDMHVCTCELCLRIYACVDVFVRNLNVCV